MKPILYTSTESTFDTNGIGILADAVSCKATEELNGIYELTMQYPVKGIHFSSIQQDCILFCNANRQRSPQPFRIYRITKPINGIVTIYAQHISYDLTGVPVKPFTAGSAAAAMAALKTNEAISSPFTFWTDITTAGDFELPVPVSARAALGGENSVLSKYGGELEFDRYTVKLHGQRGADRGVTIRYGKNLTSLEQDENISDVYTGVYPYYVDSDGNLTQLSSPIVYASGTYVRQRILTLDLSSEFEEAPTQAQLKAKAEEYIEVNKIGIPKVSLKVSFAQLEQTEEYKGKALLEAVYLGDTVSVEFAALGVSAKARCVKTVYDVLLDRYESVELGDARPNIADTIAGQQQAIKKVISQPVTTAMQNAINAATALITGNKGGYVILHSSTGDKQPDEILIMDKPDIASAVKVWRWNKSGLGYSSTGYNGPYGTAMTQDGQIVADFITVGGMNAAHITAGVLASDDGRVQFDLTEGTLYVKGDNGTVKLGFDTAGNLTVRGTIYATNSEFSGKVTATSGEIGGFEIKDGSLSSDGLTVSPDGIVQFGDYGQVRYFQSYGRAVCLEGENGAGFIVGDRYAIFDGSDFNIIGGLSVSGSSVYMGGLESRSVTYSANIRLDTDTGYLYRISSSRRHKRNIHDIREYDSVSDRIDRVRAVTFEGKGTSDKGRSGYGFIAEEMEQEFPWLTEYSLDENNLIQAESVSYDRVPAVLWADAQNTHEILRRHEFTIERLRELNNYLIDRITTLERKFSECSK